MTLLIKKLDENCIKRAQVNERLIEFKKKFIMTHKGERWESSHQKIECWQKKLLELKSYEVCNLTRLTYSYTLLASNLKHQIQIWLGMSEKIPAELLTD